MFIEGLKRVTEVNQTVTDMTKTIQQMGINSLQQQIPYLSMNNREKKPADIFQLQKQIPEKSSQQI